MHPVHDGAVRRPSLAQLALLMARDANRVPGGGTATSEVLRRALTRRHWIDERDHARLYGVSRLTPGTNLLAYCTAVGWRTRGSAGALVSWLAASVPCSVMAVVVTVGYEWLAAAPAFDVALTMALVVAILLLGASAWHLARPLVTRAHLSRVCATTVLVLGLTAAGTGPVPVLLASAAAGALWPSES
jgi:chromate transporter